MIRKITALLPFILIIILLAGCAGKQASEPADTTETAETADGEASAPTRPVQPKPTPKAKQPTPTPAPIEEEPEATPAPTPVIAEPVDVQLNFFEDGTCAFGSANMIYTSDVYLTVKASSGTTVYYTLDGTEPDENSNVYTDTLKFTAHGGSFPEATVFRARAMDALGRWSATAARTFLAGTKLNGRFSTVVFSITGDPDELTNGPDGILYGENYTNRGRSSERKVYIEAWNPDGSLILEQFGGVRVYGGYSRQATIKSLKIFSRKSYDENNKNFKFDLFETPRLDGSEKIIKKYDRLVLRNGGNDNQFAFIRDELSQRLCKEAGFDCYEGVLPAVIYLNGSYYAFFWVHESYCDKYFKEKFGDADGEFVVLEGKDQEKDPDDDPLVQREVNSYNSAYKRFIDMDLNNDSNFAALDRFMDVNNYLDFFAWNICLNNWDWPNNNFKCVRYVAAESGSSDTAVPDSYMFDGRWRFLPHDMDYTYGLYNQDKCMANYNTLRIVMNKNSERYSPLFTRLMERSDCREYFRNKCTEFVTGVLSEAGITAVYKKAHAERLKELGYYYEFMERQRRLGEDSLWTSESNYQGNEDQILEFARDRAGYVLRYLDELLPSLE